MSKLPIAKSAGVIPYAVNNRGDVSFLLGKEVYAPGWRDSDKWAHFGGKLEPKESVHEGAARECYEETAGTVFMLPEILQKLKNKEYRVQIDVIYKKTRFVCFFIQVPYMDYPRIFRNTKSFVQYTGGKIDCIEKNQLKWFGHNDLKNTLLYGHVRGHPPGLGVHSYYGRKPIFRKKFSEMMKFFFEADGIQFLIPRNSAVPVNRPHYMCFDVSLQIQNIESEEQTSEVKTKNSIYLH